MAETLELRAADGLAVRVGADGACRVGWGESDWLGPAGLTVRHGGTVYASAAAGDAVRLAAPVVGDDRGADDLGDYARLELTWSGLPFALRTSVRAYADAALVVFRLEAPNGLDDAGSGRFDEPAVAWPHARPLARAAGGIADGSTSYAHQWSEFALPVFGDAACGGYLFAPHRPPVVMPLLLIAPDGRTLLAGALDAFHEQIIAVPRDADAAAAGVRCGWHGDLATAPPGFASELALCAAGAPRAALEAWIGYVRRRHRDQLAPRPSRYADAGLARLSYWTDNGATYYYRTAPGADYTATLERVVADCAARDIPIDLVQIDSWFYPHEQPRPVSEAGAPLVPPSGMMRWEPRPDLFPDGLADLARRLGRRPLAFHSRHFASRSPYARRYAMWTDGDYAHPVDGALYDRLLASAASWGAITYEQDWMVESFLGVRGLRAAPGRARAWQEGLDRAAGEHGLTLQWCMSTPADFLQTLTLRHLTSIRTSGDYRYLFDNGLNWVWFLHTNALARALGLNAFKDVFLSDRAAEPYAEVEALLAALATGPVGIGDAIGRADRALVLRTCREDGVLVKPDAPLAALDRCFRRHGYLDSGLLFAETYSAHPAGQWLYVLALHASRERAPLADRLGLAELGMLRPRAAVLAYDWRSGTWARLEPDDGWAVTLAFQEWEYRVLCPLLAGERTVFGDVGRYATVGDRRIAGITASVEGLSFDVIGVPRTAVEVHGYAATAPRMVEAATLTKRADLLRATDGGDFSWGADGHWVARLVLRSDRERLSLRWD